MHNMLNLKSTTALPWIVFAAAAAAAAAASHCWSVAREPAAVAAAALSPLCPALEVVSPSQFSAAVRLHASSKREQYQQLAAQGCTCRSRRRRRVLPNEQRRVIQRLGVSVRKRQRASTG
jgi:hypothetical protein